MIGISGGAAEATEISGAVLGYSEPNRVSAIEAVFDVNHEFTSGRIAGFKLVYDALTGASANGAMPWTHPQVFTRPSGQGTYTTPAGEMPLDDTFEDARFALSGRLTQPLNRVTNLTVGLYGSGEHDYTSLGANGSLSRDFNKRNTTVAVRASIFSDTISPEGGRPEPMAPMRAPGFDQPKLSGDGSKDVLDLGLGLTQTLNRSTIAHLNYTYSQVKGYQTDPYKVVSLVRDVTGAPAQYLYESRPDDRTKHVLFGKLNRHLDRDIVRLSYRYMSDDWGIRSHTFELEYRWKVNGKSYLEPHLRWYTQSAADFYRYFLLGNEAIPTEASADYRLGDMKTWTVGLKHGRVLNNGHQLTVRAEYYLQTGDGSPAEAVGELKNFDLFPSVSAFIFQVGYSLEL
jgi:hypothetical protein